MRKSRGTEATNEALALHNPAPANHYRPCLRSAPKCQSANEFYITQVPLNELCIKSFMRSFKTIV